MRTGIKIWGFRTICSSPSLPCCLCPHSLSSAWYVSSGLVCKLWNALLRSPALLEPWISSSHNSWLMMVRKLAPYGRCCAVWPHPTTQSRILPQPVSLRCGLWGGLMCFVVNAQDHSCLTHYHDEDSLVLVLNVLTRDVTSLPPSPLRFQRDSYFLCASMFVNSTLDCYALHQRTQQTRLRKSAGILMRVGAEVASHCGEAVREYNVREMVLLATGAFAKEVAVCGVTCEQMLIKKKDPYGDYHLGLQQPQHHGLGGTFNRSKST